LVGEPPQRLAHPTEQRALDKREILRKA